jgi:hypothetical protein
MVLGASPLAEGGVGEGGGVVNGWPRHEVELHSPLSPEAARSAMEKHVEPNNPYRFTVTIGARTIIGDKGPDMFEGEPVPNGFSVRRLIGYYSYFVPHTEIAIWPHASGSRVAVSLRPPALSYVVLILPAFVLAGALLQDPSVTAMIGGAVFCAAFAALLLFYFRHEALHQERVLRRIFQARATTAPLIS